MNALTELEAKTLTAWKGSDPDYGYLSFDQIAHRSGVERYRVRRFVRALARKGLVQYGRGLWSDEGDMRGAGYGLTTAGAGVIAAQAQPNEAQT
jgi:Mn-dependent DtxR family transcriptional regulator